MTGAFSKTTILSISFGLEIWNGGTGNLVNRLAWNHMDLNRFCYLGWKIEMMESFFFFFVHVEKQILCFCNKCLSAKLQRVTHPVETRQSHSADLYIRSAICKQKWP